jgi:D-arabinose 1-dehydrogenase-like Zn-dependent alcohol dehydrogenase
LSIVERARLELGDAVLVAGANALALSVIVAAHLQGVRIACLTCSDTDSASGYLLSIRQLSETVLAFTPDSSLDFELDAFRGTIAGKIIYVDAAGVPNPVNYMSTRLSRFGTLVLCRPDTLKSTQVDIYRDVHRKSAQIRYWARPKTLAEALEFSEFCHRSARLHDWRRATMMMGHALFASDSSIHRSG